MMLELTWKKDPTLPIKFLVVFTLNPMRRYREAFREMEIRPCP